MTRIFWTIVVRCGLAAGQQATFWLRPYRTLVSPRESPDHVCRYLRPNGWSLQVIKTRKTKKKLGQRRRRIVESIGRHSHKHSLANMSQNKWLSITPQNSQESRSKRCRKPSSSFIRKSKNILRGFFSWLTNFLNQQSWWSFRVQSFCEGNGGSHHHHPKNDNWTQKIFEFCRL